MRNIRVLYPIEKQWSQMRLGECFLMNKIPHVYCGTFALSLTDGLTCGEQYIDRSTPFVMIDISTARVRMTRSH